MKNFNEELVEIAKEIVKDYEKIKTNRFHFPNEDEMLTIVGAKLILDNHQKKGKENK